MLRNLFLLLALFVVQDVYAKNPEMEEFLTSLETSRKDLVVACASYHENRERGYNESNYCIGIEAAVSNNTSLISGIYKNSIFKTTVYFGIIYTPLQIVIREHRLKFGITATAASGYTEGGLAFIILPIAVYETKHWGVNFLYAPETGDHQAVYAIQIKINISASGASARFPKPGREGSIPSGDAKF